jgi:hypothetical protein
VSVAKELAKEAECVLDWKAWGAWVKYFRIELKARI